DGRRQLITLTPQGRRRAESGRKVREEWLIKAMQDNYTERERQVINEALSLLERITGCKMVNDNGVGTTLHRLPAGRSSACPYTGGGGDVSGRSRRDDVHARRPLLPNGGAGSGS